MKAPVSDAESKRELVRRGSIQGGRESDMSWSITARDET